jgi:hypothetical protein
MTRRAALATTTLRSAAESGSSGSRFFVAAMQPRHTVRRINLDLSAPRCRAFAPHSRRKCPRTALSGRLRGACMQSEPVVRFLLRWLATGMLFHQDSNGIPLAAPEVAPYS